MKRIDFKKTAVAMTILCSGAINFSCDNKKSKKITILHTNDVTAIFSRLVQTIKKERT